MSNQWLVCIYLQSKWPIKVCGTLHGSKCLNDFFSINQALIHLEISTFSPFFNRKKLYFFLATSSRSASFDMQSNANLKHCFLFNLWSIRKCVKHFVIIILATIKFVSLLFHIISEIRLTLVIHKKALLSNCYAWVHSCVGFPARTRTTWSLQVYQRKLIINENILKL